MSRKTRQFRFFFFTLCIFLTILISYSSFNPDRSPNQSKESRILVKYKARVDEFGRKSIELAFGLKRVKYLSFIEAYVYLSTNDSKPLCEILKANLSIEYAEPDYLVRMASTIPNDPYFNKQWALHNTGQFGGVPGVDIRALEAWDISRGTRDVVVAIIDSGIDYEHEDLKANIWINRDEIPNNGIDDDGNGYIDDYYGIDSIVGIGDPKDDNGHGTHCAGIIGAVGNNGIGVTGVCWEVQLMALKFLDRNGVGYVSDAIECIQYATAKGAQIINCGWGTYDNSISLKKAIERAEENDILFVAAVGNDGKNIDINPFYPASYKHENILSVAAINDCGNLTPYSNRGNEVIVFVAPGDKIISTNLHDTICYRSGTSMAASFASGIMAILKSRHLNYVGFIRELIKIVTKNSPNYDAIDITSLTNGLSNKRNETIFPQNNSSSLNNTNNVMHDNNLVHPFLAGEGLKLLIQGNNNILSNDELNDLFSHWRFLDEYNNRYESELLTYFSLYGSIKQGTIDEDKDDLNTAAITRYHFWTPWSDWNAGLLGIFPSSLCRALVRKTELDKKGLLDISQNLYALGNKEDAYYYLGRIIHLLGDLSVPAHTLDDEHASSDDKFEAFMPKKETSDNISPKWCNDANLLWPDYNNFNRWSYENRGIKKLSLIDVEKLEYPDKWDNFPEEITKREPDGSYKYQLKVNFAKVFFSLAKETCKYESDNKPGYSGYGGIIKNGQPCWYYDDGPGNRVDLTDLRCLQIGNKLIPLAISHIATLIKLFANYVDNVSPITKLSIDGQEIESGERRSFSSGPIFIKVNSYDQGPSNGGMAGLYGIRIRQNLGEWQLKLENESLKLESDGIFEIEYYGIDKLGNIEKKDGKIKKIFINIGIIQPQIEINPSGGFIGTPFTNSGFGFTYNKVARIFINGIESDHKNTDSNGEFKYIWTANTAGTFTLYAVDDATGKKSNEITYTITSGTNCTISTPENPVGPFSGEINCSYSFTSAASTCSQGHSVEYRFDWGDDSSLSGWPSSKSASHAWSSIGIYPIKTQARCSVNKDIVSNWSSAANIAISALQCNRDYPMAPTFRLPIESSWIPSFDLCGYDPDNGFHCAEDMSLNSGTPIYAISNGIVRQAKTGSQGYGGVVVIEHYTGNEFLCSIYGHLSTQLGLKVSVGQLITQGQLLGYVAYDSEDGGPWGPHLHFGIKKGKYDGTYKGYEDDCQTVKGQFLNPTTDASNGIGFIDSHKAFPLVGDWDGDKKTNLGYFENNKFYLDSGKIISFGIPGDFPIVGDWDGDGKDDIGLFRPKDESSGQSTFLLELINDGEYGGAADYTISFGNWLYDVPIVGDWDGDGKDDIGGYNPNNSHFYLYVLNLKTSSTTLYRDIALGQTCDFPIVGDWDGDGQADIGVFRARDPNINTNNFYFDIDLLGGQAEYNVTNFGSNGYGNIGDMPVIGDWDGDGDYNIGIFRRSDTGEPLNKFFLDSNIPNIRDDLHSVSVPLTPSGTASGIISISYNFTTGNSVCSKGHNAEYRFDWGDGSYSNWTTLSNASHPWTVAGIYKVKAGAKCSVDGMIVSGWSPEKTVTISISQDDQPDLNTPIGSIDFGVINKGQEVKINIILTNLGKGALIINSISKISGSDDFSYAGPQTPFNIAGQSWKEIPIKFVVGNTAGEKTAVFNVNSNDPNDPNATFDAKGKGVFPGSLKVTPVDNFISAGPEGGPISPASCDYKLENVGGLAISWTASKTKSWVNLSNESGSLDPAKSTTVKVSLNDIANSLIPGVHSDAVTFSFFSGGSGETTRNIKVTIGTIPEYVLEIYSSTGGTYEIKSSVPGKHEPGYNTYTYKLGTVVSLKAIPEEGYQFSHWGGNASGTNPETSVTMDANKFISVNFSKSLNIERISTFLSTGIVRTLGISGNYAYMTNYIPREDGYLTDCDFIVLDISNPNDIKQKGSCKFYGDAYRLLIRGSNAYVAARGGGIYVIDISDPLSPKVISNKVTPASNAPSMCIVDATLYFVDPTFGLVIYDVSNSSDIIELGRYLGHPHGISVVRASTGNSGTNYTGMGQIENKTIAFIADIDEGLKIVDVTDVKAIQEVGKIVVASALHVLAIGDNAFLVNEESGYGYLRIIDVSALSYPMQIGNPYFLKCPPANSRISFINPYVYVADAGCGLKIIDYSNILVPNEIGFYDTSGSTSDLINSDSLIYIADGRNGFNILKYNGAYKPGLFDNISPSDQAANLPINVNLNWVVSPYATSYKIFCGITNPPDFLDKSLTNSYSLSNLKSNSKYYWKVIADNSDGTTEGKIWSFTTSSQGPDQPTSPTPAHESSDIPINSKLTWQCNKADSFDIYFGNESPPPKIGTTIQKEYDPGVLNYGIRYYWKVVTKNKDGETEGEEWNFKTIAQPSNVKISGILTNSSGTPFEGVTIAFSNEGGTATTDSNGKYSFPLSYGWSGSATPSKTGYLFSPSNRSYASVVIDKSAEDYTAALKTYSLTLQVGPLSGGSISKNPDKSAFAHGESVILTATAISGYFFSAWEGDVPTGHAGDNPLTIVMDSAKTLKAKFIKTCTISGTVMVGEKGLENVVMSGLPGSVKTNASGQYSGAVDSGWTGTVIPTLAGYIFAPLLTTYTNITSNQTTNYTATIGVTSPAVTTIAASAITTTSASSGGNVTSNGGSEVTARGVCWSTSPAPTVADSHTTDGSGTGSYISHISGLTPNSTYHLRAYATNSIGTAYGDDFSFTTSAVLISITVTSPNGGESWEVGSKHNITWTTTGTVGQVKIECSWDAGTNYTMIIESIDNVGSYVWKIPNTISSHCLVKISQISGGTLADVSDSEFTIKSAAPPSIKLSKNTLNFASINGGAETSGQSVMINNSGGGTLNWTASTGSAWIGLTPASGAGTGILQVSVNPAGLQLGTHTGTVPVYDPNATNNPQMINVSLTIKAGGTSLPPLGEFSTPIDGTTGVTGAIPATGWVVDDIEVTKVEIKRDPHITDPPGAIGPDNLVYIGDAIFVEGARPDIEAALPGYPMNYKAGWGYMLLTNMLPAQGNGTYKLHAYAYDKEGNPPVLLGSKTITCSNATAVKPFGTIDSPTSGGEASGSAYLNWGWVLTPLTKTVPKDGSTILVYVDGAYVGSLGTAPNFYNQYRSDVSGAFPGLNNTGAKGAGGPVGAFYLDTTKYPNGEKYTISWVATDDGGAADGIGSRYFKIFNTGTAAQASSELINLEKADSYKFVMNLPVSFEPRKAKRGFSLKAIPEVLQPDNSGFIHVEIKEVDRAEIDLGKAKTIRGYQVVGEELRSLPIGSTLDPKTGIFSWMPGPGFLGTYDLLFLQTDGVGITKRIPVKVTIKPKFEK